MGFNNIEKPSLPYAILWRYAHFWHNRVFYKKVYVINEANIPGNKPVIFTANHQNALMDALALLFNIKKQLVFMARADMFGNKIAASVLYFLKILPIFRIRDGVESVKKNDAIFNKTVSVIAGNNGLVILPEGNHQGVHLLRPLKKGFARIAFQTAAAHDFTMDIHIVPVGIEYGSYEDCRSTLIVNFGRPIPVNQYYSQYRKSPVHAINALRDELAGRIREVMLNIDSKRYYTLFDQLRRIYKNNMLSLLEMKAPSPPNELKADQTLIAALEAFEKENPDGFSGVEKKVAALNQNMAKMQLPPAMLHAKAPSFYRLVVRFLLLLAGLPLFFYGMICNFMPFYLTMLISKKIKDLQFRSSVKYLLAIFLFPLFYLLQTILFYHYHPRAGAALLFLISIPLSGMLAWNYRIRAEQFKSDWKLWVLSKKKSGAFQQMVRLRDEIISDVNAIVLPYLSGR